MATVAARPRKTILCEKEKNYYEPRISLTPTGLLMKGHCTQNHGGAILSEMAILVRRDEPA